MQAEYDVIGVGYANQRRADPRIEARIHAALGDASTVVNVGAGAGSYEPRDRWVLAVEPSAVMRAQRPSGAAPAIDASAESLPLDDNSVDAALAVITIHHWSDRSAGLRELVRVARKRVVITTYDIDALYSYWLVADYGREIADTEMLAFGPLDEVRRTLEGAGADVRIETIPIPVDCADAVCEAYYARPEAFLDDDVRRAQSIWPRLPDGVEQRIVAKLGADLADGTWDARHGHLRAQPEYVGGMRIVVAELGSACR